MSLRDGALPSKQSPVNQEKLLDKIQPFNRRLLRCSLPFAPRNDMIRRRAE